MKNKMAGARVKSYMHAAEAAKKVAGMTTSHGTWKCWSPKTTDLRLLGLSLRSFDIVLEDGNGT
jgi:hypothetical protein